MELGGYILNLQPGNELTDGRVSMAHMQVYTIVVGNTHQQRCRVRISIDGQTVGTWQLAARQVNARIEHPIGTDERFTAILRQSAEGVDAELDMVSRQDLGLIEAVFIPERERELNAALYYGGGDYKNGEERPVSYSGTQDVRKMAMPGAAMGTGLSGHSDQRYGNGEYFDVDYDKTVTITLRLIDLSYGQASPKPVIQPLRLVRYANPVPPQGE